MSYTNINMNILTTNTISNNVITFLCPVPWCYKIIEKNAMEVTKHINKHHPNISKNMNLINGHTAIYCKDCNKYSTYLHYHCYECDTFFSNKENRDNHLKEKHMKWWFEKYCDYGKTCSGFRSGMCGFNHHKQDRYIVDGGEVPFYICKYDSPWNKLRCNRIKCSYDHFWGRIRALIKKQNKINSDIESNSSILDILNQICTLCEEIDEKTKVKSDNTEVESDNTEVESDNTEVESNKTEIESDNTEVESDNTEVESNKTEIESDKTEVESDKTEVESDNTEVESDKTEVEIKNLKT